MTKPEINRKLNAIRRKITAVRIAKGYSQQYVGERAFTTQNRYSKLETGQINMTVDRLIAIAGVLNLEVNELLHQN